MLDVDGIVGESYSTHTKQGYCQRQQSRPHASVCISVGPGIYVIYGVSTVKLPTFIDYASLWNNNDTVQSTLMVK